MVSHSWQQLQLKHHLRRSLPIQEDAIRACQRSSYLSTVDGGGPVRTSQTGYLDNVLVFGRTIAEHNANLTKVLQRLRQAGLRLKHKKWRFLMKEVEYLGHVVSAQGVRTDPKKVTGVEQFATPLDVKTLRSFSCYRKFVPHFPKVAGPIHTPVDPEVPDGLL